MSATLCLMCCQGFAAEVGAVIAAEGWPDVVRADFPMRCGRPPLHWDEVRASLPAGCGQLVLLGRACLHALPAPPEDFPPVRIERLGQCFHLVAGPQLVDEAIAAGGYLITPSWLADWRGQLKALGFEPEQAAGFFQDMARELVLLDTGLDASATSRLAELQAAVGLPARRLAVGLDHTRLLLRGLVLAWRLEQAQRGARDQQRQLGADLADREAAMDLLARLARTQTEPEAVAAIEQLFEMLFAPQAMHYVSVEHDLLVPSGSVPPAMMEALRGLQGASAWTPDGGGFLLRIAHGDETLGLIAVDRLAYPASRERYLNLALAVAGVCGLAIDNARNRRRLIEAQMMASLGTVVAGVAHEINTPLGVGLASASALQDETRQLAARFAAQSMTRSDLLHCLETAAVSTDLIRRNLERIGHLVDVFRQVAVEHRTPNPAPFALRRCVEDVVTSLGSRFDAGRFALHIDCDPALQIMGLQDDWASIFGNLIGNSLLHGFKGREQGGIDIRIALDARNRLLVDYRDDGVGMTPQVRARVFDPFFTTDRQHGVGLGMHLVYNLVSQRMKGLIVCNSAPGEGAHFHLEIPLAQTPSPAQRPELRSRP